MDIKNQREDQEIDLSYLSKKVNLLLDELGYSIYKFFRFIIKNLIIVLTLLVAGVIIGYLLDKMEDDNYKHEIVVVPNFNSVSYLYDRIENLGFKGTKIKSVEIEPVLDIYQFLNEEWNNLEIAKYLSQNNIQFDKYKPKSNMEKFYKYHLITIITQGFDKNSKITDSLLIDFNQSPYFNERMKIEKTGNELMVSIQTQSIEDINRILNKIGSQEVSKAELNIETYSELNDLINFKKQALKDINRAHLNELEYTKVIYPVSQIVNIKESKTSRVILVPIALLALFFMFSIFRNLYKRYSQMSL